MSRLIAVAALLSVVAGCEEDYGTCGPQPDTTPVVQSGTFVSQEGRPFDCLPKERPCDDSFAPHEGVSPITMDLDLENERIELHYTREGQSVVERWRITRRTRF
ncbi:MAG: hypothetical protein AAGA56_08990 [Myxococcota bacterium]